MGGQRIPRTARLLLFGRNHCEIDLKGSFYELVGRLGLLFMPGLIPLPAIDELRAQLYRDPYIREVEAICPYTFFSVQRLHGFRQVVQHVSEHVASGINELIALRKGRSCSGRKSKLVEDRYIVLCTVTFIQKTKQNTKKQRNKNQKQNQTQTEHKHTKTKANKPKNNTHHRAVT